MIVTHNMQQAQRVSHYCAFFLAEENQPGRVVETGSTKHMFDEPHRPEDRRLCQRPLRMTRLSDALAAPMADGAHVEQARQSRASLVGAASA